MKAKELAKQIAEVKQEIRTLNEERQRVIDESTAKRIERIDLALAALRPKLYELEKAQNSLVKEQQPTAREEDLRQEIMRAWDRERRLFTDAAEISRGFPQRFIRPDALQHFQSERDQAARELARLDRRFNTATTQAAGQTLDKMRELQEIIEAWPKNEKMCRLGEEIYELRQRREKMSAERQALADERRQRVLAGA